MFVELYVHNCASSIYKKTKMDVSSEPSENIFYTSWENVTVLSECNSGEDHSGCVTNMFNRLCQCIIWMFLLLVMLNCYGDW